MNWIDEAITFWQKEYVKLSPPASMEQIKEVEEHIAFKFPKDFVDFYLHVDGFIDWDVCETYIALFPLKRIGLLYEGEQNVLEFCDGIGWSYVNRNDKNFILFGVYTNPNDSFITGHIGFRKDKQGLFKQGDSGTPLFKDFKEIISSSLVSMLY